MFDRFTSTARLAVIDAVRVARTGRSAEVTDEHLLAALLAQPGSTAARLLESAGVTSEKVADAYLAADRKGGLSDAEAESLLRELGIDVDQVVERVESKLGAHALAGGSRRRGRRTPFGATGKSILLGALREKRALRDRDLGDEHLLLAIAARDGVGAQLLASHGLSYLDLRGRLAKAG